MKIFEKLIKCFQKNRWFSFDEKFPILDQDVQIKISIKLKPFSKQVFVSESFKWLINEKDKQEWLDVIPACIKWRYNSLSTGRNF